MTPLLPIDWAELWRSQVIAEHAQFDQLCPPASRPGKDWWAGLAKRFRNRTHRMPQPDNFLSLVMPHVHPGVRVLDVGAGTGRYALPLARAGAQVVAVEPSAGMRELLQQDAQQEGLEIEVVGANWEEAQVAATELTICSHVLYPIADADRFLRKLDEHTLERCFIYLGYSVPSSWLYPFWKLVYGVERVPLPGAIEALALLHQLGVNAALTPVPISGGLQFADVDEALVELWNRLCLSPEEERDQRLREALRNYLRPHPDGGLQTPQPPHMAVLSWTKQG